MHSRRQYYGFSHRDINWVAQEICNDQHVNIIASEGFTKNGFSYLVLVLESAHLVDESTLIAVGEGVAVSEEYSIVVVCGLKFEKQGQTSL